MFELENICFWKTFSDWKEAVERKEIAIREENTCYKEVSDEVLYRLIQCESCGVFPFVNICCVKNGKINLVGDISFFNAMLEFVSGKRAIFWAGKEIRYQYLNIDRKLRLSESIIHSIWIRIFEEEDIHRLADIYKNYI